MDGLMQGAARAGGGASVYGDAWGGAAGFAVLTARCLPAFWLARALPDAAEHSHAPASNAPTSVLFLLAVALLGVTEQGAWSYSAVLGERFAGMSADSVSIVSSIAAVALAGVGLSALAARRIGRLSTIAALVTVGGLAKLMIAAVLKGAGYAAAAMIWQICFMGLLVQVLAVAVAVDRSGRWAQPAAERWRSAVGWARPPSAGSSIRWALQCSPWPRPWRRFRSYAPSSPWMQAERNHWSLLLATSSTCSRLRAAAGRQIRHRVVSPPAAAAEDLMA
ncbi:hypothetical protein AB0392_07030 [Nonomuraea angiospora]|uniref:hypothetical protein n=1 Tax=Nonomuraea angiospora TaxID=46172 RepID=UPI00344ECB30